MPDEEIRRPATEPHLHQVMARAEIEAGYPCRDRFRNRRVVSQIEIRHVIPTFFMVNT